MNGPAPRSYLFVPGNRPERFAKALASGADAVILDLEDAVPPDQKDAARTSVAAWLATAAVPVVLRINAADTRWFEADLVLARGPGIAAVMLAKAERVEDIATVGDAAPIIALIESALGFENLDAITAAPNVQRLAFGAIDFQLDLAMRARYDELLFFRSRLVLASRLAQLAPPIDSPSTAIDDLAEVDAEAQAARRIGFGAKLCIHPKQLAGVNAAFSPSAAELEWAQRVIAADATAGGAAFALDGKMVDRPVLLRAAAIVRDAAQWPGP